MKKFKFRYESVLKMRLDQEDRIKNELAKAISKRQKLIDALYDVEQASERYDIHIQEVMKSGKGTSEMQGFTDGKRYYRAHIQNLKHQITNIDHEIASIQARLVEAVKERKVMDKLKEKAFREFVEAINEADEKLIEEVVNFANNKRNGE